jgi:hypothetical protein
VELAHLRSLEVRVALALALAVLARGVLALALALARLLVGEAGRLLLLTFSLARRVVVAAFFLASGRAPGRAFFLASGRASR